MVQGSLGMTGRLGVFLLLGFLSALPTAREVRAQDVAVRAYLNPSRVGVGRTFIVNVEVTGSQAVDSEPRLPDMDAFAAYLGSGTSSSMQIVNNRTTVSLTLQFRYQALEEGTFEIPAFDVSVGGRSHTTKPLNLIVSAAPPPDSQGDEQSREVTGIAPTDLFVTAEASRSRVREGEPLIVEYRIFTSVDVSSYSFTRVPELKGFWVEELPLSSQPQVEQVVRDGRQYASAVIRRVALIPTGSGERVLEPLGVEAQVRVRRQSLDPFEDIFDMGRSSLFGTVAPAAVVSNPLSIEVGALPPGRPDPFSGVVGALNLTATLDQDSVDANQAVTLRVTASGEGNLRAIPDPVLDLPRDFEAYPPQVTESVVPSGVGLGGSKTWEYVLIPRAPGTRTVPSVSFGYFDTGADTYRTASTEPLTLLVSGEIVEGPIGLARGGVETLREDIRFIHLGPQTMARAGRTLFGGGAFWLIVLLPMIPVLGAMGVRLQQDRLAADPAYARRRRAGRVAHARLSEARRLASGESPREFYAEVARALRGFVADKLNVAEAGMQMSDVEAGLKTAGVSDVVLQEITACLEHSDLQRFAPPKGDPGEESRFLERVSSVMTDLSREIKR